MARALLVNPEFRSASFWNYRETCEMMGAQYPAAPLGLITVAAMLPQDWEIRLADRNVQTWDDNLLDWADFVLVGGMIAQQLDAIDVIHFAKQHGKTVIMGGPDATSSPHLYEEADHLVLDEAEVTLPEFLKDLQAGKAEKTYRSGGKRADVTGSPCPRFDLLDFTRYLHVGVQWCRGCPFNCEFCDIIELFGRVPRAKTVPQMLHEMQTLYNLGYRGHVDLVDDNFIGNKKLVKQFLPHLKTWLEAHKWPFEFTTEASLNLADDKELLQMMQDVGFMSIFVGIESPDEQTLIDTQKRQNTRRSIADSVQTIYKYGIVVNAGYILGFDTETTGVAKGMIDCIEATSVPVNMAGLLFALPTTQLSRRLQKEGRLHEGYELQPEGVGDQCTSGLNFDTLRPKVDILRDYLTVVETIYQPASYFHRVRHVGRVLDSSKRKFRPAFFRQIKEFGAFMRVARRLGLRRATRGQFWRTVFYCLWHNGKSMRQTGAMLGLYLHFGPFSEFIASRIRGALVQEEARLASEARAVRPAVA